MGMGFIPVAVFRYRMAVNNANRFLAMDVIEPEPEPASSSSPDPEPEPASTWNGQTAPPVRTVLRESFVTAGSIVAAATALVGLAEVAILVLIIRV